MAEQVYGLSGKSVRLLNEVVKKHQQRLPDVGRRTRRVNATSPLSRWCRITTKNCILDAYSIDVGTDTDDDGKSYVEARPCDRYTREFKEEVEEGEEPEDVMDVYPSKSLRGFVAFDLVVQCLPSSDPSGWVAIAGGVVEITGKAVNAGKVTLYADTDGEVEVDFDDVFEDGVSEGQTVCLTWELDGVDESRLRLSDFGCPPQSEAEE